MYFWFENYTLHMNMDPLFKIIGVLHLEKEIKYWDNMKWWPLAHLFANVITSIS